MPGYGAVFWLPFTVGLTGAGLFLSWLAWRRRGLAAGLRGLSLSLLPLVAYLTGLLQLVWRVAGAVVSWATHLAFSPAVWIGIALAGFSLVLYAVSSRLAARAPGRRIERPGGADAPRTSVERSAQASTPAAEDEFDEIEELLRKRGIS